MTDKPMTVGDVITKLQGVDPNLPVAFLNNYDFKVKYELRRIRKYKDAVVMHISEKWETEGE